MSSPGRHWRRHPRRPGGAGAGRPLHARVERRAGGSVIALDTAVRNLALFGLEMPRVAAAASANPLR